MEFEYDFLLRFFITRLIALVPSILCGLLLEHAFCKKYRRFPKRNLNYHSRALAIYGTVTFLAHIIFLQRGFNNDLSLIIGAAMMMSIVATSATGSLPYIIGKIPKQYGKYLWISFLCFPICAQLLEIFLIPILQ